VPVNGVRPPAGESVTLAVRPERVRLAHAGQPAGAQGQWALAGTVREAVYLGTDTRYVIGLPGGEKVVARLQNTGEHQRGAFTPGEPVRVWCAPEDARLLAE
jgi:ABC-type Fe3+/spermidine/putrescine transport system ATPase subunit